MNLYQSLGFLVFGSRLKRLSDTFLSDVNRIYKAHDIAFDAAWFPVFYILSQEDAVTISSIATQLEVTHSAASQLVSNLQEKGLVKAGTNAEDARKKVVSFTPKGKKILDQVLPVWTALQTAMEQLVAEGPNSAHMLQAISEMEAGLAREPLLSRIENNL
ncbi:DNA-binding transcriptional regulator, MarR family [Filimonas lacunae]|uniref:DNA-binding transcriptional regulator, MarR family n=1 Tax=Filimonas lacunae TaxID=477680 RepID=A0A173MFA1_9BACT|nr:MarR family transcriptional regulator [Filimonas lacunae]BAV06282.1 transcriptional regulator, MarR family [Filimonas lacunae]SIT25645.1 DNA-binding transcriptional regulator, MarR family [Filimonas lacunae]